MMKKLAEIWMIVLMVIVLVFGGFVLSDRHRHIRNEGSYHGKMVVFIHDSWFVDIPLESGLDLTQEGLRPVFSYAYADSVNPVLKTVENPSLYYTDWIFYAEGGEPCIFQVYEQSEWDTSFENPFINELSVTEIIDGIEVSRNQPPGKKPYEEGFILCMKKQNRTVILKFGYRLLDELKPVLEKVWEEMKRNGE